MLVKILIVAALVLVGLILFIATRPANFSVTRSATIAAAPAVVFAQVNDFHAWGAWSPWEKRDPNLKRTYEGPTAGEGAIYSWVGNREVGEGKMTLIESRPAELIRIKLEFFKPFKATNTAQFEFKPEGDGTRVTWSMTGENNFIGKAIGLVMNMDKMIGGDFESGLAGIKAIAEARA